VTARRAKRLAASGEVPRLALKQFEAAASLGMSEESFRLYVQSDVRIVRMGGLRLFPVSELQKWLDSNAARTLEER
jgi:hypothetical protein